MATENPTPPHALGRQLNFATGRANALCEKWLEPHGLTLPQWVILSCLWREGELTVGQLSELIGTRLPATSRIIDRMVARGLLARKKDKRDGRVMVVKPTAKGNELNHLADFYERVNAALLEGFSAHDQEQAFALLARIEANARAALNKG
jgi:DNA-binding MarR family transcriptional regulator